MSRPKHNSGFTLIEALVAITLVGILGGIVAILVSSSFRTMSYVSIRKTVVMDGADAVNLMQREIRTIRHSDSLLIADVDQLKFTDAWGRTIDYTITGDTLHRKVDSGTNDILAAPIHADSTYFRYYNSSNTELSSVPLSAANRAAVRMFQVELAMDDRDNNIQFLARIFPENYRIVD